MNKVKTKSSLCFSYEKARNFWIHAPQKNIIFGVIYDRKIISNVSLEEKKNNNIEKCSKVLETFFEGDAKIITLSPTLNSKLITYEDVQVAFVEGENVWCRNKRKWCM